MTPRAFIYSLMGKAGRFQPSTDEWPAYWELPDGSLIGLEAVERCETADDLYDLLHVSQAEMREMVRKRDMVQRRIRGRVK